MVCQGKIVVPLCFLMKSIILCSPSPGTLASDRMTCIKNSSELVTFSTLTCQELENKITFNVNVFVVIIFVPIKC